MKKYSLISSKNGNLQDIFFIDNKNGWAVGDNAIIVKTIDSGKNWEGYDHFHDDLRSIYMRNNLEGYICGREGIILKTMDGGMSWFKEQINISRNLYGISSDITGNFVVAVGEAGCILVKLNNIFQILPKN